MDLLQNPLIETLLGTLMNPAALVVAALVGLAFGTGLVARGVEIVEERKPLRVAAGTRSPVGGPSSPAA